MATYSSVTGCTVILLAATCGSAIADSGNQDGVTVGIMGENAPRYSGADKQHWTVMPSCRSVKARFSSTQQKVSVMTCRRIMASILKMRSDTVLAVPIKIHRGAMVLTN